MNNSDTFGTEAVPKNLRFGTGRAPIKSSIPCFRFPVKEKIQKNSKIVVNK
jgi:hypothetical protein